MAKLLLEKPVFKPNGQIPVTDFIFRQIVQSEKEPNFIKLLDFESLNLSNLELENLKGLKLPGTKIFKGMDFSSKDLSNCDLNGSDLSNCNFTRSNLSRSNLSNCNLTDANFKNGIIKGLNVKDADCSGVNFGNVRLRSGPMMTDYNHEFDNSVSIKNDFEYNGKIVIDHTTGLMWQKSGSIKELNLESANAYIAKLNKDRFAGYSDWRKPTMDELMSLLEPNKKRGLYINPIFDSKQNRCYSTDIIDVTLPGAHSWIFNFISGASEVDDSNFYIRAVRFVFPR